MPAHRAGLPHPCSALPRALDLRMLTRLDHAAAQMDEAAVEEMISTLHGAGVNFFDHSEAYGGQNRGAPEVRCCVGLSLSARGGGVISQEEAGA